MDPFASNYILTMTWFPIWKLMDEQHELNKYIQRREVQQGTWIYGETTSCREPNHVEQQRAFDYIKTCYRNKIDQNYLGPQVSNRKALAISRRCLFFLSTTHFEREYQHKMIDEDSHFKSYKLERNKRNILQYYHFLKFAQVHQTKFLFQHKKF